MTDLISGPRADADESAATIAIDSADADTRAVDQPVEWAPAEPKPRKRRLGLWIGIGVGALALASVGASFILIAPGTTIAGVPVGGMTPGMAAEAVSGRLAGTEIELTGADATLSGADLGASLDATALVDAAFAERPMWNIGTWMGEPIEATIALDPEAAESALRQAVPSSFVDPVDATVAFDAAAGAYTMTDAESGLGISVDALAAAFNEAAAEGRSAFSFPAEPTEAVAAITTEEAAATVEQLNTLLGSIGFYVGDERTVPVSAATAAEWLSIEPVDGELTIVADESAIQAVVDTLPGIVDREVVNATVIVNSQGTVLQTLTEGKDGRVLGDTSGIASDFAAQLSAGEGAFVLPVAATEFETTNLFRRIEIDISDQRVYLFENEKIVNAWAISTGLPGSPTPQGRFEVFAHTYMQDMGCYENAPYCTEDVPWITWFAPDIAFHGVYWHNNFGSPMSHGCVNLPINLAKQIYDWSPVGLEVWVHA